MKTFDGIELGGKRLAQEIRSLLDQHKSVKKISMVGNSLGGLFCRYAAKELFLQNEGTLAGASPVRFITIATPHLGVRNSSFLEDKLGWPLPDELKRIVARLFTTTGRDLFSLDSESQTDTLLYKMATDKAFLGPLSAFRARRLYANLDNDFVVPLSTAAFMNSSESNKMRYQYGHIRKNSFVATILTPSLSSCAGVYDNVSSLSCLNPSITDPVNTMIESLNALGWEKYIAYFPGVFPLAHNKLCALKRFPSLLYDNLLQFKDGEFVMDNAAAWLVSPDS